MRQLIRGVDRDDVLADDEEVVDRRNGAGIDRETVVKAVRNAQSQWTNNVNWCGIKDQASPPAHYEGKTSRSAKHDGYSTVDWGSLKTTRTAAGRSRAR